MKIKLIVWDLDDTLWSGTLAEDDDVRLFAHRAEYIRSLNRCGIVSAICSKNNHETAERKLVSFGLWDEFVFPRISFSPKAPAVKQLIADMQLRPENVLFIDDNAHNLREVKFLIPEVFVVDATTELCDQCLEALIEQNKDVKKSRVEEYRMIEARLRDSTVSNLPQEDFLRTCDIHIALVHRMDNLDFSSRIEELINRSNQLNFTKSRVPPNSVQELISDILHYDCFSVFVWDRYGYHGLVGFIALEKETRITHFVFSCRIMHMGVESWVLSEVKRLFPRLDLSTVPVAPMPIGWIQRASFHDNTVRRKIYDNEFKAIAEPPELRIMANCQSGAIAHFSGLAGTAMFDNAPQAFDPSQFIDRVFFLRFLMSDEFRNQHYPPMLVYGAFVDYADGYWPGTADPHLTSSVYPECVSRFCDFVSTSGRKALVVIPFEDAPDHKVPTHFGVTRTRLIRFNEIWRNAARLYDCVDILDLNVIATEDEAIDVRHYSVPLLKKIADHTRLWYERRSARPQPFLPSS